MKRNQDYILRMIGDECLLIPTGKAAQNFNGTLTLNETAQFIWSQIDEAGSQEQLLSRITDTYEVSEEQARRELDSLLEGMAKLGMILDP